MITGTTPGGACVSSRLKNLGLRLKSAQARRFGVVTRFFITVGSRDSRALPEYLSLELNRRLSCCRNAPLLHPSNAAEVSVRINTKDPVVIPFSQAPPQPVGDELVQEFCLEQLQPDATVTPPNVTEVPPDATAIQDATGKPENDSEPSGTSAPCKFS